MQMTKGSRMFPSTQNAFAYVCMQKYFHEDEEAQQLMFSFSYFDFF